MEGSIHDAEWEQALVPPQEEQKLDEPTPLYSSVHLEDIFKEDSLMKEMKKLDLRAAKIKSVEDHPNADRLYVINVDLGDHSRTLVAGLKSYYRKEEMTGKKVVVVANLEPAKLRGIESQGMVLAAEDNEIVSLLIANAEPGTQIEGTVKDAKQISFKEFQEFEIQVVKAEGDKLVGKEEYEPVEEDLPPNIAAAFVEDSRAKVLKASDEPVQLDVELSAGSDIH